MLGLKLSGLAAAAALALAAGSANAAIISLDVAGTVDAIGIPSSVFGSSVAVTGTVHFDTEGVPIRAVPMGREPTNITGRLAAHSRSWARPTPSG